MNEELLKKSRCRIDYPEYAFLTNNQVFEIKHYWTISYIISSLFVMSIEREFLSTNATLAQQIALSDNTLDLKYQVYSDNPRHNFQSKKTLRHAK